MALNINKVMLAGNLTRDPQLKFTANEKCVANFGLAINKKWRGGDGETKEETTFIDVECWGRTAELVGQYLTKGRNCFIEGSIKLDQWEAQDGTKRSKLSVRAETVQFIGNLGEGQQSAPKQAPAAAGGPSVPPSADLGDDEPPF